MKSKKTQKNVIEYEGREYELKYTFSALMMYENIMNASFQPGGTTQMVMLFYCILAAEDGALDYDKFVKWVDSHHDEYYRYQAWLVDVFRQQEKLAAKYLKNEAKKATKEDVEAAENF